MAPLSLASKPETGYDMKDTNSDSYSGSSFELLCMSSKSSESPGIRSLSDPASEAVCRFTVTLHGTEASPVIAGELKYDDNDADAHELKLLEVSQPQTAVVSGLSHDIQTAPVLTREAYLAAGYSKEDMQYGVLGKIIHISSTQPVKNGTTDVPRLYINTNAPFSAIVCGVQGSGKSHTVATILESMFIPNMTEIGHLQKPLCGLVLHLGDGGTASRPSEAAFIGASSISGAHTPLVRVFVSRAAENTMKTIYSCLGNNVTVEPLYFNESELDAQAFLSMMAVNSTESAPLYMQIVLSILRDLGENFTYTGFMRLLDVKKSSFNPAQLAGLEQRLSLLLSFIDTKGRHSAQHSSRFRAGQITIIDLSDPFVDPASACGLFDIILRLFIRVDVGTGKILVVDEAHKYLGTSKGSSGLSRSLLTLIREQRHLALRVIISTQEPTAVPPTMLDLCNIAVLHRFSSPAWWEYLVNHVSAKFSSEDAFDQLVRLQAGEAIVLAPSGLTVMPMDTKSNTGDTEQRIPSYLGRRYMIIKTRRRVTADGGISVLVLDGAAKGPDAV